MDKFQRLLSKLDEMIPQQALGLLRNPATKDAYGYGEASGIIKGLMLARNEVSSILNEDDDEIKPRKS